MKRILSLIIVATVLLGALSISVFAEENEEEVDTEIEETASLSACYRIDWSSQSYVTYDYRTKKNTSTNYELYYTVDKTARYINTTGTTDYVGSGSGTDTRAQFSQQTFAINDFTHYEYVFKAKNNTNGEYAGIVFAFGEGLPYIMYGAFNNTGISPNTGSSDIILTKGVHESSSLPYTTGHKRSYLKLALDSEGYGYYKIVYNGYDVSVYGLVDSENEVYRKMGDSIKLPNDAKVALGIYAKVQNGSGVNRTVNLSDCLLYAMNDQAGQILSAYDDGTCRLRNLIQEAKTNYNEIDNTGATYRDLQRAVEDAETLLESWTFSSTQIKAAEDALDEALDQMEVTEADLTQLKAAIASFEALNPMEYTVISYKMVEQVVAEGRVILTKESVRQSRVNDVAKRILERMEVLVPSGYKAPESDTYYESSTSSESVDNLEDLKSGCGGCGSSAAISAVVLVSIVGTALAIKRKKD